MHCLLAFVFCLLLMMTTRSNTAAQEIDTDGILNDIAEFNITCYAEGCENSRSDSLAYYPCHCGIQCVRLGTCCADSYYARVSQPKMKPSCRSVYNGNTAYFMVDNCPSDSAWRNLCKEEWNRDDDVMKLVPVFSISSFITYKNYYCFRCHETNNYYQYWMLQINSNDFQYNNSEVGVKELDKRLSLTYSKDMDTWMVIFDEDISLGYFPVNISLQIPPKTYYLIHDCEPVVISDCCDGWPDEEVRNKCHSYMSLKVVRKNNESLIYKNIHCALCNFESLNETYCRRVPVTPYFYSVSFTPTFSFSHLLDINRADGEVVGKVQKCSGDETWDPFTKKCRKVTCAIPGFKVKNNECVQK